MLLKVKSPFWRQVLIELGAREVPPAFPGPPGSRWHDADGDMWVLGDDGRLHAANCSLDPDEAVQAYGPMTRIGGE